MTNGAVSGRLRWAAAAFALAILLAPARLYASRNLLNNGDFSRGTAASVDEWRTDAWVLNAGATTYQWIAPQRGQPPEVEISSARDNDARWVQGLSLGPGWYQVSVEARTHNVLPFFTGANVSVLEDGIMSSDLRGDTGWTSLEFYLRVGRDGADIDLALRLGGYMNLTRGQAWFRHPRVARVAAPPAGSRVFDLATIRKSEARGPIGHLWTLAATFILLGATTLLGWRLMGGPPMEPPHAERIRRRKRA